MIINNLKPVQMNRNFEENNNLAFKQWDNVKPPFRLSSEQLLALGGQAEINANERGVSPEMSVLFLKEAERYYGGAIDARADELAGNILFGIKQEFFPTPSYSHPITPYSAALKQIGPNLGAIYFQQGRKDLAADLGYKP